MADWQWRGARWWKVDLHAHTPASDDYGKGPHQAELKKRTPQDWLLDFINAGVDCVAITDHNSGAWVDRLKEALAEFEEGRSAGSPPLITLLPGVEISVQGGVHLLAIFDSGKSTADIDSLLGAVGFYGTKGDSDAVTKKSFVEVLAAIAEAGGLAIPAHVDAKNGLLSLPGPTLKQALSSETVFAMELLDQSYRKPALYRELDRTWTEVLGSDAHHPSGEAGQRFPGSHFCWIKMSRPELAGLRLALLDGAMSVRRSDLEPETPNLHAALVLEAMEVKAAKYMGRSKPFQVGFNPWLNAVIGGRGTGKSTLVELLRLVLRREDELPEGLREDFEKYQAVADHRDDEGLLTSSSQLEVIYRKDGARFRVQWSADGTAQPILKEVQGGKWRVVEGEIPSRFPVRILSQKQIFQLAREPMALLRLLDQAPEVAQAALDEKRLRAENRYLALRAKARELEASLADAPRLSGELDDVKRRLEIFERAGHAEILKAFQSRQLQHQAIESWKEEWAGAGDRLREIVPELVPAPPDLSELELPAAERIQLERAAKALGETLTSIRDRAATLAKQADEAVATFEKALRASTWYSAYNTAVETHRGLRERLAAEGAGQPQAYGELVQRRKSLESRLKAFEGQRRQVAATQSEAESGLQEVQVLRRQLTALRQDFLTQALEGNHHVRVRVLPYAAREHAEVALRQLLQRPVGGFEKDIEGLLARLFDGKPAASELEARLEGVKQELRGLATGPKGAGEVRDQRFVSHLRRLPPEALDRLRLWFPEDALEVDYSRSGKGNDFRPIHEGSPGQKTAALLAFLLSYGEEPLILDQPEDDLDNHLIYELVVTAIREAKRHRQLLVVTHNANLVVHGDAELVLALEARGGETQKECEGSLQQVEARRKVCEILEGGEEAFRQRYRRIAEEVADV